MNRLVAGSLVGVISGLLLVFARTNGPANDGFTFVHGAVNAVVIERDGARLAVYGNPKNDAKQCEFVLLTHHRRDVSSAARTAIKAGAKAIAPVAERKLIEKPGMFWTKFATSRFHDYAQQSTKVLTKTLPVDRWGKEGDVITWRGLKFQVFDTPGYTRAAVSYVVNLNGKRTAFTGDLIYGDGQLHDLFSFQDAIPEANIRGYHGYASRLAKLIPSLKKIAAQKPDLIVPARGPVIRNPQAAIKRLISRAQRVYHSYLSTNALNWYFKEKRMRICGERVLGKGADVQLMSYSKHQKHPDWVWNQGTSRLLISEKRRGFLLDCGYKNVIVALQKLIAAGKITGLDGIFVTHCHDDHTDYVQTAADVFKCPVYALDKYSDVLANPSAYHLPALTSNAIRNIRVVKDGQEMKWREFKLSFHFYPGQMYHHGALLVGKQNQKPIFFIGDSFSPSGMDDYCLLNRNLVHEDVGYLQCLKKLRTFRGNYWLVNEHIPFVFTFSKKELDYLEQHYRKRIAVLREMFPYDDPNYGIDEQWAVFYPYGSTTKPKKEISLEVRITNHSPKERTFTVTPHLPDGMKLMRNQKTVTLGARQSGRVQMRIEAPPKAGRYIVTADVASEGMAFQRWVEAIVEVK